MKLLEHKKAHLIGIKGQGMTALAEVLVKNGIAVTGSDTDEVFTTDAILAGLEIPFSVGFDPDHIPPDADLVVYSTAYAPEKNSELRSALDSGRSVMSYPEALGALSAHRLTIAVCGTHGKTTTTALLGEVLRAAKLDPTAIVGSQIAGWGGNTLVGRGQHLILEADEYQNKLRFYQPWGAILTSVDWDHPDFFPTVADYEKVFRSFVERIPRHGFLVACGDNARVREIAGTAGGARRFYGFLAGNDLRVVDWSVIPPDVAAGRAGYCQTFSVEIGTDRVGPIRLRLSGKHNALNTAAVVGVALHLKLPLDQVLPAIEAFAGTKRRFERLGERGGVLVYDDYAHHPEEVRATLTAFHELYPERRLVVLFHPHTFTRTRALFEDFAQCFEDADRVFLLDIYGSAREEQGGVSSRELADRINRYTPGKAEYAPDHDTLLATLRADLRTGDILITMGAGDVWRLAEKFLER